MRKFGYSLKGTYHVMEYTSSTVRVSLDCWNGLWSGMVECTMEWIVNVHIN